MASKLDVLLSSANWSRIPNCLQNTQSMVEETDMLLNECDTELAASVEYRLYGGLAYLDPSASQIQ
jgi:hypothetical protein